MSLLLSRFQASVVLLVFCISHIIWPVSALKCQVSYVTPKVLAESKPALEHWNVAHFKIVLCSFVIEIYGANSRRAITTSYSIVLLEQSFCKAQNITESCCFANKNYHDSTLFFWVSFCILKTGGLELHQNALSTPFVPQCHKLELFKSLSEN